MSLHASLLGERCWASVNVRSVVCELTSFKELSVQVRQATGDRVSESATADPVIRLDVQVTIEWTLRGSDNGLRESREEK